MRFSLFASLLAGLAVGGVQAWGESPEQAARRARSLLVDTPNTFGVATLSATYPDDFADEALRSSISSGPEYFAPCYADGDLLMLAMPVSQNWRNALRSPLRNATLSITSSYNPEVPDPRFAVDKGRSWNPDRPEWRRGMPSKQRLTLFGHFTRLGEQQHESTLDAADECFKKWHPDASHWTPDNKDDSPHVSFYVRFHVDRVYRVGGFGDESSIGWLDMGLWQSNAGEKRCEFVPMANDESPSTEVLFGENQVADSRSTESLFVVQSSL